MGWGIWLVFFVVVAIGCTVLALGTVAAVFSVASRTAGLPELVATYGATVPMPATALDHATVGIGSLRLWRNTRVAASAVGLFLELKPPLGTRQTLLIPWSEFGPAERITLPLWATARFELGQPLIARLEVPQRVYQMIKPYLPPEKCLP